MTKNLLTLLCFLLPILLPAQKELKPLRSYVKANKSTEALNEANRLMSDSIWKNKPEVYALAFQAYQQKYERHNEKMYLQQKTDTADYFSSLRGMFRTAKACDKLEHQRLQAGEGKPRYRSTHANILRNHVNNLLACATFHYQHGQFMEAEEAAYLLLNTSSDETFWGNALPILKPLQRQIASLIHVQGNYHSAHYDRMFTYIKDALQYKPARAEVLEEMAVGHLMLGDSVAYRDTLLSAIHQFPERKSLYDRLDIYMREHGQYVSLLTLAREMKQADSVRIEFLRSEAFALRELDRADELPAVYEAILRLDAKDPLANLYLGKNYINMAEQVVLPLRRTAPNYADRLEERRYWYSRALPHIENYRKGTPADSTVWAPLLYQIYLNLNMGKEFEEILRYMPK